jgi:sulfate transport system ATP-binding protein
MITTKEIRKQFGRYPALNGVSLAIEEGELLALLGPSGSGKTTLLRVIAGLEFPEAGQVLFDDEDVTYTNAAGRQVGFVFQQYALFKHMTLARNIAFGLDVKKGKARPPRAQIDKTVEDLLSLVELGGMGKRYPSQLSGGQRQRVALARALAVNPRVLLLDEPFGALDATVRKSLRRELRRIHDATGVTTIFVTHDQEEALELADRVAILNHGQIEQVGAPDEVHDAPKSAFVCGFVGEANRYEGAVDGGLFRSGAVELPAPAQLKAGKALAFVRPHHFSLAGGEGLAVRIDRVVKQGPLARLEGHALDGQRIEATFARQEVERLDGGEVRLSARKVMLFGEDGAALEAPARKSETVA